MMSTLFMLLNNMHQISFSYIINRFVSNERINITCKAFTVALKSNLLPCTLIFLKPLFSNCFKSYRLNFSLRVFLPRINLFINKGSISQSYLPSFSKTNTRIFSNSDLWLLIPLKTENEYLIEFFLGLS